MDPERTTDNEMQQISDKQLSIALASQTQKAKINSKKC